MNFDHLQWEDLSPAERFYSAAIGLLCTVPALVVEGWVIVLPIQAAQGFLALFLIPLIRQRQKFFAAIHGFSAVLSLCALPAVLQAVASFQQHPSSIEIIGKLLVQAWFLGSLVLIFSSLWAAIRLKATDASAEAVPLEQRFQDRVDALRTLFQHFDESVQQERNELEKAFAELKSQAETNLKELERSKKEVAQYRLMNKLSEEERQTHLDIIAATNFQPRTLLLGIAIGMLSSTMAQIAWEALKSLHLSWF